MKISQFCLLLRSSFSCEFVYADPEKEIYTFKPAPKNGQFAHSILYITQEPEGDIPPSQAAFNLLVYGPGAPDRLSSLREVYPYANMICVQQPHDTPLSGLYGVVADIFLAENRFTAQMNRMSYISSSNLGMQALIDEASRILETPIVVIDSSYSILATSSCELPNSTENLNEQRRIGALTTQNLERMQRNQVFEQMRKNPDRMHYSKAPDAQYWWINMLIYVHGIEVAEVGIMEDKRKLGDYDFEFIKHLRYLIALEIQRGHFFSEDYSVAHSLLVAELLEPGAIAAGIAIRHRAALLGWKESPFYSVLSIFPQSENLPECFYRQAEIVANQVFHYLPRAYWRIGTGDIAFLIPHDKRYTGEITQNHKLCELLKINHMTGVLGNPVTSLIDVRKSYEQAQALYLVREHFQDSAPIHRYCDHSILHIAGILHRNHVLEEFFHPYVLMLRDYDKEHNTDYLMTLYQYLTYIDNPTAISKHLHIHKNTLYYRMNKLRELFPIDLNDGHVRLYLHLTMEMMRLDKEDG